MKVLKSLAMLSLALTPLFGRIGETENELIKRFGPPAIRAGHSVPASGGGSYQLGESLTFTLGEWWIACDLVNGVCARISYSKPGAWTEENFQSILTANARGAVWTDLLPLNLKPLARKWRSEDGTVAHWVVGSLSITSTRYEKMKALLEQEAVAALPRALEVETMTWPALFRLSPVGQKVLRLAR